MDRDRIHQSFANGIRAALLAGALILAPAAGAAEKDAPQVPEPEFDEADSTDAPHAPSRVVIRGVVRDANGGPVRGATIRFMSETDTLEVQTDRSGKFRGALTVVREVDVMVRAYGYRDLVRTYRASRPVIQAAFALPPPYPLGWVTITRADPSPAVLDARSPRMSG